ncbi:MAG: ATP-binding cassette domain-containing protein, partial [Gemmataceae bacterium]
MPAPLLQVVDLHKRFQETVALDQVSFQVETGSLFGLLGPNGAGKTTLLAIVAGTLHDYRGEVLIDGVSIR